VKKKNRIIIESILALARNLNISVVLEGVEDINTLKDVKGVQDTVIQGYHFSQPLEKKDFKVFCNKGKIPQLKCQSLVS